MFRRVLVPVDLSDRNQRVLRSALEIAGAGAARITVLHVVQKVPGIPSRELADFYARLREKGQRRLTAMIDKLDSGRVPIRAVVRLGDPAPDIVKYANQERIDLIVMGSHTVDPVKRGEGTGWGTTSYKVALLCACPVLLVK